MDSLNTLNLIKPTKGPESSTSVNIIRIDGSTRIENYCQGLLQLALDLKNFLRKFETSIEEGSVDTTEAKRFNEFLQELNHFFSENHFSKGKSSQTWVDLVYIFFGMVVYYQASLRVTSKTIELFYISESLANLEKTIFNNMYYNLTSFTQ